MDEPGAQAPGSSASGAPASRGQPCGKARAPRAAPQSTAMDPDSDGSLGIVGDTC